MLAALDYVPLPEELFISLNIKIFLKDTLLHHDGQASEAGKLSLMHFCHLIHRSHENVTTSQSHPF